MFIKTKKIFIGIIAIAVSLGILGFFYQYSERSSASTVEIPVEFSKTELSLTNEGPNNYVEINLRAGTNRLSGATVLMSYPKDIVTATIDNTNCKALDSNIIGDVDATNGTIIISRVSIINNDEELPTGLVCFARINFVPKLANGNGILKFVSGPIGSRNWEIIGPNSSYTPKHNNAEIPITLTGVSHTPTPTVTTTPGANTPTPTTDPNVTATITPSPTVTTAPTVTRTPTPTTTVVPTNTPVQPTPGTGVTANITFDIRTQGLTAAAKNVNEIPVLVTFLLDETEVDKRTISMSKNSDGSWTGTSKYETLIAATDYTLLIKGPKHLQKKICVNKPSEAVGGQYTCKNGSIRIQAGDNRLELKGVTLLAGDLPIQNGIVDAVDIAYVRSNLGKSESEILSRADLNYDGIVDSQDYGMIINALSFKYDEEE